MFKLYLNLHFLSYLARGQTLHLRRMSSTGTNLPLSSEATNVGNATTNLMTEKVLSGMNSDGTNLPHSSNGDIVMEGKNLI